VEGLKRAKVKSPNYSQVTVVQSPKENPLTFLQYHKDSIRKHTTVDPESQVGEVLLKDKFLTQSAQISIENSKSLWLKGKKIIGQINAASHVCIL
jgi:hypothetical protein